MRFPDSCNSSCRNVLWQKSCETHLPFDNQNHSYEKVLKMYLDQQNYIKTGFASCLDKACEKTVSYNSDSAQVDSFTRRKN